MINLYPYQTQLVAQVRDVMRQGHRSILVQSPTGSGKTVIFTHIVSEMIKRGKRALIVTDRVELLTETGGTLQQYGINAGLFTNVNSTPVYGDTVVAMSQTLRRRLKGHPEYLNHFDVIILDEAHKAEFNPYFKLSFAGHILGFTATPFRAGKQMQLAKQYTRLILGPQVPELVRDGFLVRDRYYGIGGVDMSGVGITRLGDYDEGQMFDKFNKPAIYAGAVENWQRLTPDTLTLGFCVNIMHTVRTCCAFNDAGIPARFITSRPTDNLEEYNEAFELWSGEREEVLHAWKREGGVLLNAGILTTGFNWPPIQTILVNRATASLPLWLQIMGRGSRTHAGKGYFNVLDFGDNAARHGYYNQQRDWSLLHREPGGGAAAVKECKGCGAMIYAGQRVCPFCGYEFPADARRQLVAELAEVDYTSTVVPAAENRWYSELERLAESRGYKQRWVIHQIFSSEGLAGLRLFAKFKGYNSSWVWQQERFLKIKK